MNSIAWQAAVSVIVIAVVNCYVIATDSVGCGNATIATRNSTVTADFICNQFSIISMLIVYIYSPSGEIALVSARFGSKATQEIVTSLIMHSTRLAET